jgi:hypothetical protein|tara:strand:+ start:907 stop:1653 length:747 start_codon:yes stop_codon:yes gene_type:complete
MTTYAQLTQQILDYTEVSTDVLTSTITDDFIRHTENDLLRQLDIPAFHAYQYTTFTASNPFLIVPGGTAPTPSTFSVIRSVNIVADAASATTTGDRTFLEEKDRSFMNEYWPNRNLTGTPKYYTQWDYNSIYVVPTPSSGLTFELSLSKLDQALSSSVTTSWLSLNAPKALLYGCLVEAFTFLKGPMDILQTYTQSYAQAVQAVAMQQMGRAKRDEYMHGALRITRPSLQPQLGSIKPMGGATQPGGQ